MTGHVARLKEKTHAYRTLVHPGRSRRKYVSNIRMDRRKKIRCCGIDWLVLAQDRIQWRARLNTIENPRTLGSSWVAAQLATSEEVHSTMTLANPSIRTMALGSTQPLAGMVKGRLRAHKVDILTAISADCLEKCGNLDVSEPYGPTLPVTERAFLLYPRQRF
jgi:hypothetical protein